MISTRTFRVLACGLSVFMALAVLTPSSAGAIELDNEGKLELTGDFRLRLENDWDSLRADGTERDDRLRARIRARLALTWQISEIVSFGARIRSGSDQNHQTGRRADRLRSHQRSSRLHSRWGALCDPRRSQQCQCGLAPDE